jgi:hypothetical protein
MDAHLGSIKRELPLWFGSVVRVTRYVPVQLSLFRPVSGHNQPTHHSAGPPCPERASLTIGRSGATLPTAPS